jgi:REP element-mobilizing transposase RayT
MPQSLANILVHLIFSTKDRRPLIRGDVRERLHAYIVGILENQQSPSLQTNSVVQEMKQSSSKWIKGQGTGYSDFGWQNGYAAFSVSESQRDVVREYIRNQREHHAKVSFQDELRQFFKRHGVDYDERYVWD